MSVALLEPGSPEWLRTPTASKIPAILGVSRHQSQFACWHEMAGIVEPAPVDEQTQEMFDYGHAAELAAREYWLRRNPGWRASRREVQYHRTDLPGISLAVATIDRRASRGKARKIVEIKTARDLEEFGDDGSGEVPVDYAVQVTWQMIVTHIRTADLVLWPDYGRPRVYPIEFDEDLAQRIITRVAAWEQSLASGVRPDLDNSVYTYECLRRLHPDIDRGAEIELDEDFAAEYLRTVADRKLIDAEERGLKIQLLDRMGRAQYAMCQGHKIADRRNAKGDTVSLYANTRSEFLDGVPA
ncbi:hypothetical protein F8M49_29965 [Rhodococcus zopfii]|uniref:YqaJ viral recombinase domain-containing protein n=1 Tax=Rhodococcus zopfii TaxID=43772 RepID=A0ABU3WX51_9NOCA|nr:hypothetical protein [Rhodococcus zopfii]